MRGPAFGNFIARASDTEVSSTDLRNNFCVFFQRLHAFLFVASAKASPKKSQENVAIYGAGAAGIQLMDALGKNPNYTVKFFIDDPELIGRIIGGVKILSLDQAKKKFTQLNIETLLLATPGDSNASRQNVFDILSEHQLKAVKTVPSISSLISGRAEITHLRDIKIEDLLGRESAGPQSWPYGKNHF